MSRDGVSAPRRALGAFLLAASFLPFHRLLDPERAGPAAAATRAIGQSILALAGWGTLLSLGIAALLALLVPAGGLRRGLRRVGDHLVRPSPAAWALGMGIVALAAGLAVALGVLSATPTLLDEMVQLLHARALAEGRTTVALPSPEAARLVQNGLATPGGWASIYPPGHTALLAVGIAVGAPWMVGPLLLAATAAASALAFTRLLPGRPRTARLAGLLVAFSPFMAGIGGGYLSHASAAAFGALALLTALLARDGRAAWAMAAGLAMGGMVASRPWIGLTLGAVLTAGVWLGEYGARDRTRHPPWLARRLGLWMVGGAPLAAALGLWNARLFGHPLRFGYEAAFGPAHGVGLHRDPWGNLYGLREAVGYTGFDVAALGVHLLETPLPLVALVGAWLLLAGRLPRGAGALLAWGVVPLAANALYWHHGYHMGPRMLYEAAPAWLALSSLAAIDLAGGRRGGVGDVGPRHLRARVQDLFLWTALLLVPAGLLVEAPGRLASYRPDPEFLAGSRPPRPPGDAPALVFVHGGWAGRVASRLSQAGMRRDSIETALRRNALCRVHLYAEARLRGDAQADAPPPALDLEARPGTPPRLRVIEPTPGNTVRVDPDAPPDPSCARELTADRMGVVELAPLLWRTALPGAEGGVLLARDLGPAANRAFRAAYPEREAWMWLPWPPEGALRLLPYDEAEAAVWGRP